MVRIREEGEVPSAASKARPTKLRRSRYVTMSCRVCGFADHNKRTCPNELTRKAREAGVRVGYKLNFYFKVYVNFYFKVYVMNIFESHYSGICLQRQSSGVNVKMRVNVDNQGHSIVNANVEKSRSNNVHVQVQTTIAPNANKKVKVLLEMVIYCNPFAAFQQYFDAAFFSKISKIMNNEFAIVIHIHKCVGETPQQQLHLHRGQVTLPLHHFSNQHSHLKELSLYP